MITARKAAIAVAIAASFAIAAPLARAEDGTTFEVSVKDHQFQPAIAAFPAVIIRTPFALLFGG